MTNRDEFIVKWRSRLMVLVCDAWACRKEPPSALGFLMDSHTMYCKGILVDIHTEMTEEFKAEKAILEKEIERLQQEITSLKEETIEDTIPMKPGNNGRTSSTRNSS